MLITLPWLGIEPGPSGPKSDTLPRCCKIWLIQQGCTSVDILRSSTLFCRLLICFKITFFAKKKSGITSECQAVWIRSGPIHSGDLIWFQTVCKCYQQTTLGGKELNIHAGVYSGARCLKFGVRFNLLPNLVYAGSEGFGDTAQLHRFVCTFTVDL